MNEDYKGYYHFLKEELDRFRGEFDDFILHIPNFFKLLSNLLNEDIDSEDRKRVNCALGYFVAPTDVIPEEIYGPLGYIDDIFLCCYVLKELEEKYGPKLLRSCWEADEDIKEVLDYSYEKSKEEIEERGIKDEILEYSGLKS